MSFNKLGLKIERGGVYDTATVDQFAGHSYKSTVDDFAAMTAANYFPDFLGEDADTVLIGDTLTLQDSTLNTQRYAITAVSPVTLTLDPTENPFDQTLNTTDNVVFNNMTSNGEVKTDTINEITAAAGVTIDTVLIKDGLVDTVDVSALKTDVDGFPDELKNLTAGEITQLENIDATTISGAQWGYVGGADQALKTTDAPTFATVDTGQGANELYAMDQDVQTTDAVTFATVNTGQGANELYAMDQPVRSIDDVTFGTGYIGGGTIDAKAKFQVDSTTEGVILTRQTTAERDAIATPPTGLIIYNTDDNQLQDYDGTDWGPINLHDATITHSTTWGGAFSTPVSGGDVTIYKVGRNIVAHFSDITGTADTATTINATTALPSNLRPESTLGEQNMPIQVTDNGTIQLGMITISAADGSMTVFPAITGGSFAGAGSTGFQDFYISWIANV